MKRFFSGCFYIRASIIILLVNMLLFGTISPIMQIGIGLADTTVQVFPICTAPNGQFSPRISGNYVVWQDYRKGGWSNPDIYGYNLAMGEEFPICTVPGAKGSYQISGNYVVWQDYRKGGWIPDIYGYNLSTGLEFPICTAPSYKGSPQISGNYIVWQDYRKGDWSNPDIYGYNLSTGQEFPICVADGYQSDPRVSGNYVVWFGCENGIVNLHGFNLLTGQEFPIHTGANQYYGLAMSDRYLAWVDFRNGHGDIYGFNLLTGQEFLICTSISPSLSAEMQVFPICISGDYIVWQDYRNGGWNSAHIYGCNLATGQVFPICTAEGAQHFPLISGNYVVWTDFQNPSWDAADIFGAKLSDTSIDTVPPTTTISFSGTPGNNDWYTSDVTVSLSAKDNDGGSGVAKTEYSFDGVSWNDYNNPLTITAEGTTTVYYRSTDNVGNVETTKNQALSIDKTPPTITISIPTNGAEYLLNQLVLANWLAVDVFSGLFSSSGSTPIGTPIDTLSVGAKSFTIAATDNAGNGTQQIANYYVRYAYSGVLQPINVNGSSVFKLGSTIPVKFQIKDANSIPIGFRTATIQLQQISTTPQGDSIETFYTDVPTTGNAFRYDDIMGQYIYNLSTKGLTAGTYRIRIYLDDDTIRDTIMSLK